MLRVLIIEDEPDVAEALAFVLQDQAARFDTETNGAAGFAAAVRSRPDLILLDIMLPGMSGWEVLRALRAQALTKNIPVLVVTARQMAKDVEQAFSIGADGFVNKPFNNERLRAEATRLLAI